ncbi:hypothetical protein D3C84_1123260 [compost metagenome]
MGSRGVAANVQGFRGFFQRQTVGQLHGQGSLGLGQVEQLLGHHLTGQRLARRITDIHQSGRLALLIGPVQRRNGLDHQAQIDLS